ncbi:UbiD family decarboxylase [Paenibacillus urinalis]|uniref:UbiD family decarboxylase n=1 Tax=Paenibacillus urinalis TaxID=521520 RepID=A0ABY7X7D5_9BACL|nr:UbiD family decarboxylase [Paenibacillus urinalis]WDI00626.1 UbiD family decarboxylase [Paenibacillus urinalis]
MYTTLESCLIDLERNGHLVRIREEVDPELEMAAIHLRVFEAGGPALLFENVKGSSYRAVSNLFGTIERSKFMFRQTWDSTQNVIALRNDPMKALKNPFRHVSAATSAIKALPLKRGSSVSGFKEIRITDLPLIKHWPMDGGAFVTLPQVYTEDPDKPGIMKANLGMYRVQLTGNDYTANEDIGLHYQIHRGIGIHQHKANRKGEPLKVSIFIGGPPAHTLSAVMPLPEGLSELLFAGLLSGRRFRYGYDADGFCISHDADFVITGEIHPGETKPEGPFGDHFGYYSLIHPFPMMRVRKVYAKQNAIWPFTVVGRPPQEDTAFGDLIHQLTGGAVKQEVPGVKEVHAVDAAGVHPLLLAIGSERYTPYTKVKQPAELLTIANRILGTGQLSLAKYLFIAAEEEQPLSTHHVSEFFSYILERIDLKRDIHFQTNTTIDTLDYSGSGLNQGSKVVFAACGDKKRELCTEAPEHLQGLRNFVNPRLVLPGVVALEGPAFSSYSDAAQQLEELTSAIRVRGDMPGCPLIILCDDSHFLSGSIDNFLWATFTRSNPSHDIYGVNAEYTYKHWGCDNIIIDARTKPHHAPPLIPDQAVEQRIDRLFAKSGSLHGVL